MDNVSIYEWLHRTRLDTQHPPLLTPRIREMSEPQPESSSKRRKVAQDDSPSYQSASDAAITEQSEKTASTLETIEVEPIGKGLNIFHVFFSSKCQELGVAEQVELLERKCLQDLALCLLSALQTLPAARSLRSRVHRRSLYEDLLRLPPIIGSENFDMNQVIPLLRAVITNETDESVWKKVYHIVAQSIITDSDEPSTPPLSSLPPTPSFQETPWTYTTAGLTDTTEIREKVDPILKAEVGEDLRIDHQDILSTFFGQIQSLDEMTTAVLQACEEADQPLFQEHIGWTNWPKACEEKDVLEFLIYHVDQFVRYANDHGFRPLKRLHCIAAPDKPISGSVNKRKLDVGLAYDSSNEQDESGRQAHNWSHILIPGELKSNPTEDKRSTTWLGLAKYAREIFSSQDTRRFVLGFTLCGSVMRILEFDRLGVVGSESFDINKNPYMLVKVVLGFLWMSEEELGFDPTIEEDGNRYTTIWRDGQRRKVYLQDLIKRQRSITGRATTCWKGILVDETKKLLVIKDSWEDEERPEEGLLLKEVTEAGVNNVARYYHHETVRIGDSVDDVLNSVRKGLDSAGGRFALRHRVGHTTNQKRSCSVSLAEKPRNRVHRRLIMLDVGKSLYEASSLHGILTGLLGGIKGHESLLKVKVLHRDISIGNVMLYAAEDDGFLIDLDLAIKIDREDPSGAPSKTGTKVFMAIGALYGEPHTYMHDLESFFWVLFWVCVHWNGPGQPRSKTEYESWNYEKTQNLAEMKKGKMDEEDKFMGEVAKNFTTYCQPLIPCILELRKEAFPNGKRWKTGEPKLHSRMISVFERTMKELTSPQ